MTVEHDDGYDPYNSATTRKTPPIPDWLRNDPELERIAFEIVNAAPEWLDDKGHEVRWHGDRYRK